MENIQAELHLRQHMLREDYEIFHFQGRNGAPIALHFHDFYECSLLLSGALSYQIESVSFAEQPGDLLLIGPNQLHRPLFIHGNEPYERIVFWLSRPFVERLSESETDLSGCFSSSRTGAIRLDGALRAQVTHALFELLSAGESDQFGRDVLCRSLAASLLVLLNRISLGEAVGLPNADLRISPLIQRVSAYLDEHLGEDVTLDELSRTVFLSKYYLERRFKRETGVSIYRMLLQKRMIRARNLMREGMPLTNVAQSCGFSEYSGFYKAFRGEYGLSPRAYQRLF